MDPLVSINIPTYNSGRTLSECLESIKKQEYRNIEVVIIDSYSKDSTLEIANRYGARIFSADSLAQAREVGVRNSLGKYIFLVDSDQVLEADTVSACVAVCEEKGFDGVTLFERSKIVKNTFAERIIAYDKWLFHTEQDDDPVYGSAIPRFFRADFLQKVNFSENPPITFEHSIIHQEVVKMGAKITFLNVYINHYETPTFTAVAKKFYRYGYYYIPAFKKRPKLAFGHSLPRRSYFSIRMLKNPILGFGLFMLYLVKATSAAFGGLRYTLDNLK